MEFFFKKARLMRDPTVENAADAGDPEIQQFLGYEIRARALRREIFDSAVINDSSWLIMQDLLAAALEGRKMRTKELCATTGLPQTTVIRYLDHLEKFGVVHRESDEADNRVTLVSLSESGAFWMRKYYGALIADEQALKAT